MTLPIHAKKKIEITLEAPALRQLSAGLEAAGVKGYTILPVLGGAGHDGPWRSDAAIGAAGAMVMVTCVVDPAHVDEIIAAAYAVVSHQIGMLTIADVMVVRSERF